MMLAFATILLSALTAAPSDVTGKWEGSLTASRPDGSSRDDTVLLILTQKDGTITGTVGESETDQHPITAGTIDGEKVVIAARHATNGREYKLELKLQNEELHGTVTSGEMKGEVRAKRRQGIGTKSPRGPTLSRISTRPEPHLVRLHESQALVQRSAFV